MEDNNTRKAASSGSMVEDAEKFDSGVCLFFANFLNRQMSSRTTNDGSFEVKIGFHQIGSLLGSHQAYRDVVVVVL